MIRCLMLLPLVAFSTLAEEPITVLEPAQDQLEIVGRGEAGELMTPVNQRVTPTGRQLDLPGMRPQVLALHPEGSLLVTAGKTAEIVIMDPTSGDIRQRVPLPAEKNTLSDPNKELDPDGRGQVSFTGLVFSPDGSRLYLSNVNGSIKVFTIDEQRSVNPLATIPLPAANAPRRKEEIPAGLALNGDGSRLYVAGNLSNQLFEIDTANGRVLRTWEVGVAPYGVVLAKNIAFVSNWGGRRPDPDSLTGPAGKGTLVRVDPVRHIASEGSLSVIDLEANTVLEPIMVGLHASDLRLSPDGRHVVVANAAADTVSVIEVASRKVVETISSKQNPAELFAASPNALAFSPDGERLFVANGTLNAVAVIEFEPGNSTWLGLIPAGWYPGALVYDPHHQFLHVANIKGIGLGRPNEKTGRPEFNTHQYFGSISAIALRESLDPAELKRLTTKAMMNCREPRIRAAFDLPRPDLPPVPLPERTGEPSLFQHVIYIIKENRTYDQVLGDMPEGNGDPELCIFGEEITPNHHRLARDFMLLDNTYCCGILSADGHQWSDAAIVTDYLEKSFAGFPRSYPDGMEENDIDALAYSPAGFLWDNAIAHGKSLRVYGEFAITETRWKDPARAGRPRFTDYYRDFLDKTGLIEIRSRPAIESLRPYLCSETVGWDMDIPDIFRAHQFIRELREFEEKGECPNLMFICLPNDHTSGTAPKAPTPRAHMADNDLALGQIVEAITRSKFWPKTCIFVIEDDPQNGWDHVSGYRTLAYVISPYSRNRGVVSTQYNQTSLIRSMELILGLPPMNIMDASAGPMFDCFGNDLDPTPWTAEPARIALDELNPDPSAISDPLLRHYAQESAKLPLDKIDQCPEDLFNRILWHAMKGSAAPYPEWAITLVDDDD